ncbi:MAG: branched-chain amino acid ABC transporter substrate-binding protein [Desulfobacterales bacterium]|nr:branched-chain amino acid ABC transporter substrate-binding protein [Desulfobacterales bacterium]
MLKKLFAIITAVLLVMVISAPVMAADTIKIAYIDPLSGAMAGVGDSGYKHFQYNAELLNAKGVLGGKKFEIVPFDNKTSPQDSLIQLKNAIDQGITIVTQGNGSSVAGALIEAINKHNERNPDNQLLYLNYAAVTPAFTNELCSFWHFRFDAHVDMKIAAITNYIKGQKNIKKVYLMNQDYVFGHAVSDAAKAMLKEKRPDIEIVGDSFTPLGKVKDFSPYVAKIQASGADTIISGNWGADMSLAIGEAGIGILNSVTEWHINLSQEEKNAEDEKFFLGYHEKYSNGGEVPYYYGRIRTTMTMLAAAIEKAGSVKAKDIAYALEGMEYQTPYGKVTMRAEDHQLIQPLYLSTYAKVGQGTVRFDAENSGVGFKTIQRIEAADTAMPTTCKMVRPEK